MGGGLRKNPPKKLDQQEPRKPSPIPQVKSENPSPPQSPKLPVISSRRPSVHSPEPSIHSQAPSVHTRSPSVHSWAPSVHSRPPSVRSRATSNHSITNLANGNVHRTPSRELDNNSPQESDDTPLPPIVNPHSTSKSRSSTRASSVAPPPPIHPPRKDSDSSSESHKHHKHHSHRTSLTSIHGRVGHCSHCPHCQRMKKGRTITSSPEPKWITKNPGNDQVHIIMDEYDVEAVKKKILSENGHLPGSYDYGPYLTMEQTDDIDIKKENYFTQPVVAKTIPRVSPARTPFPDYNFLQRREQRVNKPYSIPLFVE